MKRLRDLPLWGIVASFLAWEWYAHFRARNVGSHTLSNRIWKFESKTGLAGRAVIGAGCVALFLHLVIHLF